MSGVCPSRRRQTSRIPNGRELEGKVRLGGLTVIGAVGRVGMEYVARGHDNATEKRQEKIETARVERACSEPKSLWRARTAFETIETGEQRVEAPRMESYAAGRLRRHEE